MRKYKRKRAGFRKVQRKGRRTKKNAMGGTRKRAGVSLIRSPGEFIPDRMFVPLEWVSQFNNIATAGDFEGSIFYTLYTGGGPTGSGAFLQPNYNQYKDGGAGQDGAFTFGGSPNSYHYADVLAPFYNNFRIFSSSIKIDIQKTAASSGDPADNFAVSVYPCTSLNAANLMADFGESAVQPYCKYLEYSATKTGNKPLYHRMGLPKLYGISKQQLKTDPGYYITYNPGSGSLPVNAAPANQIVWVLGVHDVSAQVSRDAPLPASVYSGTVKITTMFEFFGRITAVDPTS